jgi:serine phosphatase RsbU (regulator of sigma subunit)
MAIIIKGTVKVTKREDTENDVFVCLLKAGSYFGEFSLIDNLPRSASITAVEDTEIFILHKEAFDVILSQELKIANSFYLNCLQETFSRFRDAISNFTFSQHVLHEKTSILNEINEDLSLAKRVQRYFLNTKFLNHESHGKDDIKHTYIYHPCIEIGGDFINITKINESSMGIIIADVMGHGITAALATGVLKSAYSIYSEQFGNDPARLMGMLNSHFLNVISELYATCYYSHIDKNRHTVTFAKAGHHHPFFWKKKTGEFVDIECSGSGLGLVHDAKFGKAEFSYDEGDKILLFTDGIIEQVNEKNEMYSESRLRNIFKDLIETEEPNILDAIFTDLKTYAGDIDFEDDITMLLLEF